MPCVDDNYKAILSSFQGIRHAFILTPGDNDWTDCWPLQAQKVDPLELLAKVRTMFFPEERSLGQRPITVKNQSADPSFAKHRGCPRPGTRRCASVAASSARRARRPRVRLPIAPSCTPAAASPRRWAMRWRAG